MAPLCGRISVGLLERTEELVSAAQSPMDCALDAGAVAESSRCCCLGDDGVAGAGQRDGFSVNEDVGDVERVQEDRLEHRSRRRKAACRSDGLALQMPRKTHMAFF